MSGCCKEVPIPELGFDKAVRVCTPCVAFRARVLKDQAAAHAMAQADDEDDNSAAAGGKANGKDAVLSYDSD